MLRSLLLEKVAPKQFHDKEMEGLRTFYPGDMGEDMLERMVFKPWLELSMVETSRVLYDRLRTSPAPFGGVASKVVLVRHCWPLVGRVVFFTSIRRSKDQTLGASERRLSVAKTGSGCKQNCWRTGITKATIRIKEVRLVLALGGAGRFLLSFFHRFPGSSRSSPSVIFDEAREEKEPEGGSRVSFNRNLI
ncbi:hypothetical protein MRB53_036576 [Persea americana]|nr:hypothetical protein MRB53_036766 [Persea americana]KAJ8614378.1 hypothetical protein MRB53_036576 [Persea americana]